MRAYQVTVTLPTGARRDGEIVEGGASLTIGKEAEAGIQLEVIDPELAPSHVRLTITDRGLEAFAEAGAPAGFAVNGRKCKRSVLKDGDLLLLGATPLRLGLASIGDETGPPGSGRLSMSAGAAAPGTGRIGPSDVSGRMTRAAAAPQPVVVIGGGPRPAGGAPPPAPAPAAPAVAGPPVGPLGTPPAPPVGAYASAAPASPPPPPRTSARLGQQPVMILGGPRPPGPAGPASAPEPQAPAGRGAPPAAPPLAVPAGAASGSTARPHAPPPDALPGIRRPAPAGPGAAVSPPSGPAGAGSAAVAAQPPPPEIEAPEVSGRWTADVLDLFGPAEGRSRVAAPRPAGGPGWGPGGRRAPAAAAAAAAAQTDPFAALVAGGAKRGPGAGRPGAPGPEAPPASRRQLAPFGGALAVDGGHHVIAGALSGFDVIHLLLMIEGRGKSGTLEVHTAGPDGRAIEGRLHIRRGAIATSGPPALDGPDLAWLVAITRLELVEFRIVFEAPPPLENEGAMAVNDLLEQIVSRLAAT